MMSRIPELGRWLHRCTS